MRILILALLALSCNPGKQLQKAEVRLAQAGRLPAICAERYPVKIDTFFVKDSIVKIDTFLSGEYIFDTIHVNDTVIDIQYKPLEIIKTKTLTKVEVKVDKAVEGALKAQIAHLEADKAALINEVTKYKGKAKNRLNWLILLIAAGLGYSIRKPLTEIIKWNLKIS